MAYKKIEFQKRRMIYFITAPVCICLLLIFAQYSYLNLPVFRERCLVIYMPGSVERACELQKEGNHERAWAADTYGHLNIVLSKNNRIYYHNIYRKIDENPCHHLTPDKTQIRIFKSDIKQCDLKELSTIITKEQGRRSVGYGFIVTFSFLNGVIYQDFISMLDAFDECDVRIYSIRELTSTERDAINSLMK